MAKLLNKFDNAPHVPTQEQISSGGVAYRRNDGFLEITIVLILPDMRWQLPKGIIDPGETPEIAAVREVNEEAGVATEIVDSLGKTEYWFHADREGVRTRFHKYVHWFLLRYLSGNVNDHDHEVAESRWVSLDEALRLLVFKNEREIVEKAGKMIAALKENF